MPESVKTIDYFDNTVGNQDKDNPDDIAFLENIVNVLQSEKAMLVGDLVTLTMFTRSLMETILIMPLPQSIGVIK